MKQQNEDELIEINNYLYLTGEKEIESCFKRCKKKFMKKYVWHKFTHRETTNIDEYPSEIYNYLKGQLNSKLNKRVNSGVGSIGILLDGCITMADITSIVNVPCEWDILCLNADVCRYIWKEEPNNKSNIYWNKTIISDTRNFVINWNSINKIIECSKTVKTWKEFIDKINNLCNIYTISGSLLSEKIENYIHFPNEKYNSKTTDEIERQKILDENEKSYIKKLENFPKNLLNLTDLNRIKISKPDLLPPISLICPFTDKNRFFNSFYTFLKLDYPQDKLELVIIDPNTSDKYLKRMLPDDPRIKILNIGSKNKNENNNINVDISLGYMLNLGVKYAKYELICHFFDTNFYIWQSFKDTIVYYILSNRDLMMSCDTGVLNLNKKQENDKQNCSEKHNVPDIGNMIYKKSFWKVLPFNSQESNRYRLVYKFIYNRISCISQLPFVLWSYMLSNSQDKNTFKNTDKQYLKLDLKQLVPEHLNESFQEITNSVVV